MLKTFLAFLALATASTLSAQTNSFVEVSAEDTIQLEAEEIIYMIAQTETYMPDSLTIDSVTVSPPSMHFKSEPLSEVRRLVQTMRLDTLNEANYTITNNNNYYRVSKPIRIRFTSAARLKEFTNRIQSLDGIVGGISTMKSSKEKTYEKLLFQRLYGQAKTKAEMLAQITGKRIDNVISIKEQVAPGGWTMYPPLSEIPGWHTQLSGQENEKMTIRRGIVIQFSWK